MSFAPTLRASAAGCSACRASIVRLFTSPHAPGLAKTLPLRHPSTSSALLLPRSITPLASSRLYSTERQPKFDDAETVDPNEWNEADLAAELQAGTRTVAEGSDPANRSFSRLHDVGETEAAEEDGKVIGEEAGETVQELAQGEQSEDKPWYLQEEPPRHPTLVPDLQPLPEIPRNTPAILADLVKCVAEDMGLDDLNLMDLRTLDPPAALGPSLIMLFGSARSERHLHISAGRLKSWLRQRGFNAHADGLMGRKDFKVQLRRKQRRAKLLGTTPSPTESGLTTRWVCMNLGTIGYEATDEMPFASDDGTLNGFGVRQTGGTTIVIQMFTESKRQELGLETLWSRILARTGNKLLVQDDLEYAEAGADPNEVAIFTEGGSPKVLAQPSQRRFFSTSSRRLAVSDESSQVTKPSPPMPASSTIDISVDPMKELAAKIAEVEQMRVSLDALPYPAAVEALSPSETGRHSASMEEWNAGLRHLAPEQSWRFRLWLVVAGRKLGLQTYGLNSLCELVEEMELLGIICHRSQYVEVLQAIYLEHPDSTTPLLDQSQLALDVLNVMFERGEPIIAADVIVSLLESLTRTESPSDQKRALQEVLEKFIHQAELPYFGEAAVTRLLDAYASQDSWERWWAVWRMAPQHGLPRSDKLYTHMWATMAATQHQRRCREALRTYYMEMLHEQPPVRPVGAVKEALEACLRVAEPEAETIARKLIIRDRATKNLAAAEFVHMWRVLNPQWVEHSQR